MILKEIVLKNFRQFKDINQIDFSNDTERNVTLILGDNTSGKSTVLQAFLWCMYEDTNFARPNEIRNKKVSPDTEVYVELHLIHSNIEYIIRREVVSAIQSRRLKTELKVTRREDVNTYHLTSGEADELINKILPKDLSPYFFYDTERFNTLTSKRDLKKSVKTILGLAPLESLVDYLGDQNKSTSVIGGFYRELDLEQDDKLNETVERRNDLQNLLEVEENKLKEHAKNIADSEEKLYEIRVQLKGKESVASLEQERQKHERELSDIKNSIEKMKNENIKVFKANSLKFFMKYLTFKNKSKLDGIVVDKTTYSNISADLINSIIEESKCICGTSIDESREQNLKELLNEVKSQINETQFESFKRQNLTYDDELFMRHFYSGYKEIYAHIGQKQKYEREIEILGKKIERDKDAKSLEIEKSRIEEILENQKIQERNTQKRIGAYEAELDEKNNEIDKKIRVSKKNEEIKNHISYAKEILNWVNESLGNRETYITKELTQKVNAYFKEMYHGNREIEIDSEYIVTLYNNDEITGEKVYSDESKGLETVKNFAFISALIDLAKGQISDDTYDPESYPLAIDAPFSNADETHVKSISNTLPKVTEQLIMIVMEKDWKYAKSGIEGKIGKKYLLNKIDEHETVLEEV